MAPINFPQANDILHPAPGTEEQVMALPIYRYSAVHPEEGFTDLVLSAWKPSEEELKRINEGKPIYFMCYGKTHPPIRICTEKIFDNED